MLVIPASLKSQVTTARTHAHALCWKITQPHLGGSTFRFTDWPHEIEVKEGDGPTVQAYTPTDGIDSTARRRSDELEGNDKEIRGVVSSTAIKAEELRRGLFDGAQVDEYLVDARRAWAGYIDHARYFIRKAQFDRGVWLAEVDGIESYLSQRVGETWGPLCRVDLFSTECGVNAGAFEKAFSIDTVIEARRKYTIIFADSPGTDWANDGHANDGTIIWGAAAENYGIVAHVKEYLAGTLDTAPDPDQRTATITLHFPVPFEVTLPDGGVLRPGCNKRSGHDDATGDCKNKYSNLVNFQGEPFIPGRDKAVQGIPVTTA